MRQRLLALMAVAVGVTGCTGGSRGPHPDSPQPGPPRPALVRAAHLDLCPPSAPAAAPRGLPAVTLPCLGRGPAVHLAGLRGRPLVVNVWGSWCTPCQRETPFFTRTYDALSRRVRFLGVDDEDDPNSALDFAVHVTPRMRYPSVRDDDKRVLLGLQATGPVAVPSTLFVSASGRLVHREIAAYRSVAQLRADIARYLGVRA